MSVILILLTALAVLVLVVALVYYLNQIIAALEHIGGEPRGYSKRISNLGKIAMGVRAIEQETGHLGPEVTRLNGTLTRAAGGLQSIDGHLARTIDTVVRQEGGNQ